ncbi:uncharacterized protein LOC101454434 [Ceratitis capitata]|uniref:uncharacterized protein LOC101454434 n=1 Tax=Ceratitis capitata TaxID=7213 RepID=UPI000C6C3C33|nr:uncharacterized protein LOC101454434 [Ceratitis capitata]
MSHMPTPSSHSQPTEPANISSYYAESERVILLATAEVLLKDYAGRWQPARALLDNGSHASFITEACVQRLHLPRISSSIRVTGIGSIEGGHAKGEVKVCVSSRSLDSTFQASALILSKITNDLPPTALTNTLWPHIRNLPLADPNFSKSGPIDVLIGMDEMEKVLLNGLRKGQNGTPMAQNTTLGWVLFGNTNPSKRQPTVSTLYCDAHLTELLTKVWELDEPPSRKLYTPEELYCEKLFDETTQRAEDGRFIVRLPIKEDIPIGESRNAAVRALLRMERQFNTDKNLHDEYKKFMKELIDLGHMEAADSTTKTVYYMPHHAVVKDTSATTKLRVVFNASMKTSSGKPLNDALMVGPQLQQDLFSILVRFRTHRYGLIADIEKMYRQVHVAEQDVDYQRIVWREHSSEPICDYRLLRVTYGVASASHLAVKSLHRAAQQVTGVNRNIEKVVTSDFYMDDLLTGSESLQDLINTQRDISHVLSQSGFELRKWATNFQPLREQIPHASTQTAHLLADGNDIRTLGCIWHTDHDSLSIAFNLEDLPNKLTKRIFLSDSSKIFDPLGLIAPCTIRSKIWLQMIWRSNVDWDELVPPKVAADWLTYRRELQLLSKLKMSRWLGMCSSADEEFHVFTDASEAAYAAAIYCRTKTDKDEVKVVLIAAKTRVAPLKTTSLPRLELCAAHLGARLVRQIQTSFGHKLENLYAWTDSMITLAWLQGMPSRWSVFVANRVADVQEVLPASKWRHVVSELNPADCASRGINPSQLITHPLWWTGPNWLRKTDRFWCKPSVQHNTDLEQKPGKTTSHVTHTVDEWSLLTRFHSYNKLKRITAYVIRFIHNLRLSSRQHNGTTRLLGHLTTDEIREAEIK